jgi:hypothetical protein
LQTRLLTVSLAALVAYGLSTYTPTFAQTNAEKLHIEAFAVNMSNIATGSNQILMIDIDSWSTDAERQLLIDTMLSKGQDQLLKALQKQPKRGRMWYPQWQGPDPQNARLGYTLRYTRQRPLPDGGRQIVIALDRYIGFWEARNQPRSFDYPFSLLEIRAPKEGKGEGKLALATKISFDKDKKQIELENYASEPVRLQNVQVEPKK